MELSHAGSAQENPALIDILEVLGARSYNSGTEACRIPMQLFDEILSINISCGHEEDVSGPRRLAEVKPKLELCLD